MISPTQPATESKASNPDEGVTNKLAGAPLRWHFASWNYNTDTWQVQSTLAGGGDLRTDWTGKPHCGSDNVTATIKADELNQKERCK